ncbi:MAG: WecB/TagA/CpsF family glycosyltransferase [Chloroflexi bacterium]|nr:WecB/TagA/CpsF family glycosyltransferase [Chloroflexota bacterium]
MTGDGPHSEPGKALTPQSLSILGVRVDDVTYDESLALVARYIAEGGPHVVTTPNPEIVMEARRDPAFRALLARTALNVPDGVGLLLAARLRGRPFRDHVRGTDLVLKLAALGAAKGHRWFLLGAADGVAQLAADRLCAQYPRLQIVGAAPGSPRPEDDSATWAMIRAAGPVDLILVAYGAPTQERWLDRSLGPLGIPVGIGVGGVLNFLSGLVPRAPVWIQRLELEWLHRLAVQPWRWKRQLKLPLFVMLALDEAARKRRRQPRPRAEMCNSAL